MAVLLVVSFIVQAVTEGGPPSTVFGLFCVLMLLVGVAAGITGIIFGAIGLKRANTQYRGRAIAGFVLGIVAVALSGCCLGLGVIAGIGMAGGF